MGRSHDSYQELIPEAASTAPDSRMVEGYAYPVARSGVDLSAFTSVEGDAQRDAQMREINGEKVVFYRLSRKFIDESKNTPDKNVDDVMYYTLAVGHHTGVIDCFDESLTCSIDEYQSIVALINDEDAAYKLNGIVRSGEIQVGLADVPLLRQALEDARDATDQNDKATQQIYSWIRSFLETLDAIERTPAIYLMGRRRAS